MNAVLAALGTVASELGGILIARLLTAKVGLRLIIKALDSMIKSEKTGPEVDDALKILKEALENK